MSFFKGASLTFLTQIVVFIIAAIVNILTAKYFGPPGVGILAYLTFITALSVQIGILGVTGSNVFFLGQNKQNFKKVLTLSIFYSFFCGSTISVIIFILAVLFPRIILVNINITFLTITLISLPFLFLLTLLQSISLGLKQYYVYNMIPFMTSLFSFLVIVVIYAFNLQIIEKIIGTSFCTILIAVAYLTYLKTEISYEDSETKNRSLYREMLNYGIKSYFSCLLGFLTIQSNIFLINWLLGSSYLGIYSVAYTFAYTIYLFPAAIGTVLFSTVSSGSSYEFTQKVFRISLIVMTLLGICLFIFARVLIIFLYGPEFEGSVGIVRILIPGIIVLGLCSILNQDLAGRGFPLILIVAPFIAFIIEIIFNIILIAKYQIIGSSLSITIAFFLMFFIILFYFKKVSKCKISKLMIMTKKDYFDIKKSIRQALR